MIPAKIKLLGDKMLAQEFIGPAMSQLNLLINQMKFQKLKQGVRRIRLSDNIYVECQMIYGSPMLSILANVVEEVDLQTDIIESDLFVVFGLSEIALTLISVTRAFEVGDTISGNGCSGEITSVGTLDDSGKQNIFGVFENCVLGTEITAGESSGTIQSCNCYYYYNNYNLYPLLDNKLVPTMEASAGRIISALDIDSLASCDSSELDKKEWSKTLKTFMVSAVLYQAKDLTGVLRPYDQYENILYNFTATYNGIEVTGGLSSGFRYKVVEDFDSENDQLYTLHIGFDLWEDDDENYFVGFISDSSATLKIYKLNKETYELELQNSYTSTVRDDYYTYLDESYPWFEVGDERYTDIEKKYYVRLLGYGYKKETNEHVVYWGDFEHIASYRSYYAANNFYCSEVLNDGTAEKHFLSSKYNTWYNLYPGDEIISRPPQPVLISAIWNPLTRTIQMVYDDNSFELTEDIDEGPCEDAPWATCYTNTANTSYGDFILGTNKLSLGSKSTYYSSFDGLVIDSSCSSFDAKRYNFTGGIFTLTDDSFFNYETNDLVPVAPCSPNSRPEGYDEEYPLSGMTVCEYDCLSYSTDCYDGTGSPCGSQEHLIAGESTSNCTCLEYNWIEHTSGDVAYAKYASETFPHDEGWTAILLSGIDINKNEYENWVIYKDLETDGNYLVVSDIGNTQNLSNVDRAFFFQYYDEDVIDI